MSIQRYIAKSTVYHGIDFVPCDKDYDDYDADAMCVLPKDVEELERERDGLIRACLVLYYGSPELHEAAENAFSDCASTQRNNAFELRDLLEKNK